MTNNAASLQVSSAESSSRHEVIERCLPLVKSIASRLRLAHHLDAPFDDIYELGLDGLMQAAERFDPARGVAFTTFAYYRIRGAILDSFRRDPARQQAPVRRAPVEAPRIALSLQPANDNGRADGAPDDHARELASPSPASAITLITSLEELESVPDETAPHPDQEVERRRLGERIATALSGLCEIERRVIELRYYEDLSFSEIGAVLGICKPWAFRLHNKAIRQLRETLGDLAEAGLAALTA